MENNKKLTNRRQEREEAFTLVFDESEMQKLIIFLK